MQSKQSYPALLIIITAFAIALPKPRGVFTGLAITYAGFALLNLAPLLIHLKQSVRVYNFFTLLYWGCIGYGIAAVAGAAGGEAPLFFIFAGSLLWLTGFLCLALSVMELVRYTETAGLVSDTLHTGGMYSLVRHPQTLSAFMLILGLCFHCWSLALLISLPLWLIGLISYAALEEKYELVPRFENRYIEYCETTPGLLPTFNSVKQCMSDYS